MKRGIKDYLIIGLKGIGMGAADVIPGVSGGTIAFITGIYEELIFSIRSVNAKSLKLLLTGNFISFAKAINLPFLMSLLFGVAISILSLAKLMTYFLEIFPIPTWSFFFGLIISSAILVGKKIERWNFVTITMMVLGILFAYAVTTLSPASTPDALWFIFLSGMLAICAMILPGISGAFILLMLGKYAYMLEAIELFDFKVVIVFLLGALIGIVSFSNVLGYFLKHYHNETIALLTGFMIGSLNKVWPWKEVLDVFTDRNGEIVPLVEQNILPSSFTTIYEKENQLELAVICAILGFALIFIVEMLGNKLKKREL